jgi:FHA domain
MTGTQYRLVMRQGPVAGQVFELSGSEITIGRDISNDYVINESEVSRKHARISLEAGRYKIEDLGSTNGTYIDGQRLIGPHLLAVGELIMFGDNVGVIFEGPELDVTVPSHVEVGSTPVAPLPVPVESYPQQVISSAPPAVESPVHQPAVPRPEIPVEMAMPQPEEEFISEPEKKPINSWILAGCGCVVVVVLLLIALLIFIDQPWKAGGGLYCVTPFDIIFKTFGYCQ